MIAPAGIQRAKGYASSFTWKKRENEEIFWHHHEDTPEFFTNITKDAHDNELPNDWRYATCSEIADAIVEGDYQSYDDVIDEAHTIADSIVDVYTMQLLNWSCHLNRQQHIDDVLRQCVDDGQYVTHWEALTQAQHACIYDMVCSIAYSLFEKE